MADEKQHIRRNNPKGALNASPIPQTAAWSQACAFYDTSISNL